MHTIQSCSVHCARGSTQYITNDFVLTRNFEHGNRMLTVQFNAQYSLYNNVVINKFKLREHQHRSVQFEEKNYVIMMSTTTLITKTLFNRLFICSIPYNKYFLTLYFGQIINIIFLILHDQDKI